MLLHDNFLLPRNLFWMITDDWWLKKLNKLAIKNIAKCVKVNNNKTCLPCVNEAQIQCNQISDISYATVHNTKILAHS